MSKSIPSKIHCVVALLSILLGSLISLAILGYQAKVADETNKTPQKFIQHQTANGGFLECCKRNGMDMRNFKVKNVEVVPEQDKNSYLIYLTLCDPKGATSEYKFSATYDETKKMIIYDLGVINEIRLRTKASTLLK